MNVTNCSQDLLTWYVCVANSLNNKCFTTKMRKMTSNEGRFFMMANGQRQFAKKQAEKNAVNAFNSDEKCNFSAKFL